MRALALVAALLTATPVLAKPVCVEASWYGKESCVNPKDCRTANGEPFTGLEMTAAMPRRSEIGHRYRVTYAGHSVVVRINDLGPAKWTGRGIDLSKAAARRLPGFIEEGHDQVCLERLS